MIDDAVHIVLVKHWHHHKGMAHTLRSHWTDYWTEASCLQAVLKEGSAICDLVLELIIQLARKLQHELLENEFRGDAVHQQLIHLAPHCKEPLGSLLCQDIICNLLHRQANQKSALCKEDSEILKPMHGDNFTLNQ